MTGLVRGARRCRLSRPNATCLLSLAFSLLAAIADRADAQVMDKATYSYVLLDQLEYAANAAGRPVRLDGLAWIGGDINRVWFKAEGEQPTTESTGELEVQVLYGRLIAPFFDALAGVRLDTRYGGGEPATRALAVFGLEGLAPYWFEFEPSLFVSQRGDVSARITTSYDLLLTQRLVMQPRLEINAALQDVHDFGVGSGLSDLELGTRVRYEIRREVAPYLGVSWIQRMGNTADMARTAGTPVRNVSMVAGVRLWW